MILRSLEYTPPCFTGDFSRDDSEFFLPGSVDFVSVNHAGLGYQISCLHVESYG